MSSTTHPESRQTRRWRDRQVTKRAASSPRKPYVLVCRCETAQGDGFWIMTAVDGPEEGDAVARDLHAAPADVLGERHLRCELAVNTAEDLRAWGIASAKRRTAARRLGEVLR